MILPLLCSAFLFIQEADTLKASRVSGTRERPVLLPYEEADLRKEAAASAGLDDVLRRFTGVQLKDYGGAGGLKTVNVRSLGSEHVGVFLDGIQIENAQNMQVDLGRFSADDIDGIALFTGQKVLRLQTAKEYAAGASLYLRTAAPASDRISVKLRGGPFGTVSPSIRLDKLGARVRASSSASFVYSDGRYKYPYFDTCLVRENADIRSLRLQTRLYGKMDGGEWNMMLYTYGSERGFPGPVIRRAAGFPFSAERQSDQDLSVQGAWTKDWSNRYSTALRAKCAYNYTHYATHPEKNPMALPYDLRYRQYSAYCSAAQSFAFTSSLSADMSCDLQGNWLDSPVHGNSPSRLTVTSALALKFDTGPLRIAGTLAWQGAYDHYPSWRDAWMPSIGLTWEPRPWLGLDAYARRSYRLPSFNDLYYTLAGNTSLNPESALQLGADLRLSNESMAEGLALELRLSPYFNRVSDKIVAIPTISQFRWTMLNIGLADITGLDVRSVASFSAGRWKLRGVLRYSFQQALDHSVSGSLTFGNQLPYVPKHSATADLDFEWKGWRLFWETLFTGERWSRSANIQDYHIPSWSICDVALSRRVALKSGAELNISLRCSNVFGLHYQVVQGYPMPGRSVSATLDFKF